LTEDVLRHQGGGLFFGPNQPNGKIPSSAGYRKGIIATDINMNTEGPTRSGKLTNNAGKNPTTGASSNPRPNNASGGYT